MQKRTKSPASQGREVTEGRLLENAAAREAFNRLTDKGLKKEELLRFLNRIPYASDKKQPLVAGMSDKTLRSLPDRIKDCAQTIEQVLKSHWFDSNLLVEWSHDVHPESLPEPLSQILTSERAKSTAALFHGLPEALRLYGDCLRAWLWTFHPTGKRKRDLGFRNAIRPQRYLTLQLLRLTRDSRQRPCYPEIADLLAAAFDMANKPRPKFISEDNLPKLEKRNPWIRWVLHEESLRARLNRDPQSLP